MDVKSERIAFESLYNQGMEQVKQGNISEAKILLTRSADYAMEISRKTDDFAMKMQYQNSASKILQYVSNDCKTPKKQNVIANEEKNEVECDFQPVSDSDKITFKDVAGLEDVKRDIMCKVIMPIKDPDLASKYKIKAGGKILLYGPPGTGKTFIAKAVAGEVDAKFYSVNCQDLISKYMGESSAKLDKLFDTALQNERAVIFFDEIDSIASKREGSSGADGEMARFVATFLTKIDGFKKSKTNKMLLLLAASNRPWALDNAMVRGGRFDTQIYVQPPDYQAILFMVKKEMSDLPLDKNVNLESIAECLQGFGGGDVVSICEKVKQRAYYRATKSGREEKITNDDFMEVIKNQKNVITLEALKEFEDYKNK